MAILRRGLLAALLLSGCTFHVDGLSVGSTDSGASDMGAPDGLSTLPVALAFVSAPQTMTSGSCSSLFAVQTEDASGNPADVAATVDVALAAAPAGLHFYGDPQCTIEVMEVSVPAGGQSAGFYLRGTMPGAIVVTASATDLTSATQTVLLTAGAPAVLAFATAAQMVNAGTCSGATTVEVRDTFGAPSPVGAGTTVSLSADPSGGFAFYSDAACTNLISSLTIAAGTSAAGFRFKGIFPIAVAVTASAPGLPAATQAETLQTGPPATLMISTAQQKVPTEGCSAPVTLQARDAGGNASATATVTLSSTPPTGVTFYSDAACTMPITSVTATGGTATFYFSRNTGGSFTIAADSPGATGATQNETSLNMVLTGTCTIAAGNHTSNEGTAPCTISPALQDINKTFMVFQSTSAGASTPADSDARCVLTNTTTITCDRNGIAGAISIRWYTVSLAKGLRVQHLQPGCVAVPIDVTVASVDPTHTFLLFSSQKDGATISTDDLRTVSLTSATNVHITTGACGADAQSLQVVEYLAANVTRGSLTSIASPSLTGAVTGLSTVDRTRAFLLYSFRSSNATGNFCNRMLRGGMTSDTALQFSRGDSDSTNCSGGDIDEVAWERVELPAGAAVQAVNPTLADAADTATVAINSVDLTRAFAFAGGQWTNGQSIGEGTDTAQEMGAVTALHRFVSATSLEVKRGQASKPAQWTSFVVQMP